MKNKNLSRKTRDLNNHSLSKKFLFSLAAVSVLSTYADAEISGAGCSGNCGTVSEEKTDKITVSGTNNTTLTITSSGSVKPSNGFAIEFQNGSSLQNFNNQGTIKNGGTQEAIKFYGATIDNFKNSGLISGNWSGLEINGGEISNNQNDYIKTFENSGTIQSTGGNGIYLNKGTIDTFTNKSNGLINGINKGINLQSSTINSFNNDGIINSKEKGVYLGHSTINSFKNNGTIVASGNEVIFDPNSGLELGNSRIETFENTGTISGPVGVYVGSSNIDKFINKGVIEGTLNDPNSTGILLDVYDGENSSTIKNFSNEGTIKGAAQGIIISNKNKIETLINKGTIEVSSNGIMFYNYTNSVNGITELGQINLEEGSVIKAGQDGIHIDGSKDG
ncbi:hypothetical protein ACRCD4_02180, partial [Campylobacter taeniopygiae]